MSCARLCNWFGNACTCRCCSQRLPCRYCWFALLAAIKCWQQGCSEQQPLLLSSSTVSQVHNMRNCLACAMQACVSSVGAARASRGHARQLSTVAADVAAAQNHCTPASNCALPDVKSHLATRIHMHHPSPLDVLELCSR